MYREVIFDLETKKLFSDIESSDPADLGVSLVSVYRRTLDDSFSETEGELISFWENEFDKMWPIFQVADRIIGYNSLGFDVLALMPHAPFPFKKLPHFDIMQKIKDVFGRRISLDDVAKETLDREKIDHGLNAVYYWEKGDGEALDKLKKYCEDDVIITKEIYDFGLKNGFLKFKDRWNTPRRVEIDFSYPQEELVKQGGLF